jgi:hypothetical protein
MLKQSVGSSPGIRAWSTVFKLCLTGMPTLKSARMYLQQLAVLLLRYAFSAGLLITVQHFLFKIFAAA